MPNGSSILPGVCPRQLSSKNMGPRRNITGELEKAIRARGMRFFASFHHSFSWMYYEKAYGYDAGDGKNADLYAARVAGWAAVDEEAIPIATGATEEQMPALASNGNGLLLCAYEKHEPDGRVLVIGRILQTR